MTGRSTIGSVWFWASACLVSGGLCWFALSDSLPLASEVTAAASPPLELPSIEPATYQAPPLQAFDAITARPLFAANRRPYEPPPEPVAEDEVAAPQTVEPPAIHLVGVMLSDRDRSALFKSEVEGWTRWIFEGQAVDGWRLDEIEAGHALLTRDGLEARLQLRPD